MRSTRVQIMDPSREPPPSTSAGESGSGSDFDRFVEEGSASKTEPAPSIWDGQIPTPELP